MQATTTTYTVGEKIPCPMAGCNNMPMVLAVKKANKNQGRLFTNCNTDYGGCGEFTWLDGEAQQGTKRKATSTPFTVTGGVVNMPPEDRKIALDTRDALIEIKVLLTAILTIAQKQVN